jgi:hypothetical protein
MALTTVQTAMQGSPQYYAFKNRIINGAMNIWQRGTSFSNPTTTNFYTADRWGVNRAGDATGATVSQSTSVPAGFQYSLKLQRTAGDSSTAGIYLFNSNETANTIDLAGQSVTISFWAKAGANYSGGSLSIVGYWGTGTDQRVYSYTGSTAFISATQAITTTWTKYSFTGSVGSSSTEVGFQLSWTPTGTASTDDSVYITGVQLEVGSSATSFDYRPYGTELALCQRYYQKTYDIGTAPATSTDAGIYFVANAGNPGGSNIYGDGARYPVIMRAAPTVSFWDRVGNVNKYSSYNGGWESDNDGSVTLITAGQSGFFVTQGATSGHTASIHWAASAEL